MAGVAMTGGLIKRMPGSTAMVYLLAGIILGEQGLHLVPIRALDHSSLLEHVSEFAILVSLFTAGLKLRTSLRDEKWWVSLRLAFVSLSVTIALTALAGVYLLQLSLAGAVILGAILAPTDPVLASDVQVNSPLDRNRLRFALTGEAGLNDGTAMPAMLLGLHLLQEPDISRWWGHWFALEATLPLFGGLALGALLGTLLGKSILYLRTTHGEALGYTDFVALGVVGVTYGITHLIHANGFLAVFAAGYALRRIEMATGADLTDTHVQVPLVKGLREELARDPEKAPMFFTETVLVFNSHFERLTELAVVVLVGTAFRFELLTREALILCALLFVVIRPIAVLTGLAGVRLHRKERGLISWFGVKGIGSLYYLAFALSRGVSQEEAAVLVTVTISAVVLSIFGHGLTVTPLMAAMERRTSARVEQPSSAPPTAAH